jgi:hypothetical protein
MASASRSQQNIKVSWSFALKCAFILPGTPRSQESFSGRRRVNHALVRLYEMLGRLTDTPENLKKQETDDKLQVMGDTWQKAEVTARSQSSGVGSRN